MSTDTDSRARAEELASAFFTRHQQSWATPIPGSHVSFVEGVLVGQRDAQEALDELRRQKKAWLPRVRQASRLLVASSSKEQVSAKEIARLSSELVELKRACDWVEDERYANKLNRAGRQESGKRYKAEQEIARLKDQLEAMRG